MKRVLFLAGAILAVLFTASYCYGWGDAAVYKVTIQEVQIKTSDGSWVTIATPNQEIDIASAGAAGAIAGAVASDGYIPTGSYVNFKVILSETMSVSGSDPAAVGGARYTDGTTGATVTLTGNDITDASTTTWAGPPPVVVVAETNESDTLVAGNQGEVTFNLELDAVPLAGCADDGVIEAKSAADLGTPIEIKADSTISMYFQFDVSNTVVWDGTEMNFFPPQNGTVFGITVDGATTTVTAANMEINFCQTSD